MSFTASSTGGNYKHNHSTQSHILTINEMPSHAHTTQTNTLIYPQGGGSDSKAAVPYKTGTGQSDRVTITENTGGNQGHSHGNTGTSLNIQPYIAVYFWRRRA